MAFSFFTQWLRNGRIQRTGRQLRVETMEDRSTPSASLVSTNVNKLDIADQDTYVIATATDGRYAVLGSTATDLVADQSDIPGTFDLFWFDTLSGDRKLITATASSNGTKATGQFSSAVISADGQSVAFASNTNAATFDKTVTPGEDAGNSTDDIFVWRAKTGLVETVSRDAFEIVGLSNPSSNPAISRDGRFVAYTTTKPVQDIFGAFGFDDAVNTLDIIQYDTLLDDPTAVTRAPISLVDNTVSFVAFGKYGDVIVDSSGRYMDGDGKTFAYVHPFSASILDTPTQKFTPTPTNAITNKTAGDIYHTTVDLGAPTTQLVTSVFSSTSTVNGVVITTTKSLSSTNSKAFNAVIPTNNPQAVVFTASSRSGAGNELVAGYQNTNGGLGDLFYKLINPNGGTPTLLVSAAGGSTSVGAISKLDNINSYVVSSDGTSVAFSTKANNLTPTITDTNGLSDVFYWNINTRVVQNVSSTVVGTTKTTGNGTSSSPSISGNGQYVAFTTTAKNLSSVPDLNDATDVFVRNMATNQLSLASASANGAGTGSGASWSPLIGGVSDDASIIFNSFSNNLDPLFKNIPFSRYGVFRADLPIETNNSSRTTVLSGLFAAQGTAKRSATVAITTTGNDFKLDVTDKITPFQDFAGEVRVASGDFNGDGIVDIVTAAGPGGGPRIKVYNGVNPSSVLRDFFAFETTFRNGLYVTVDDFNGDGKVDLAVAADQGGGPRVTVFDNKLVSANAATTDVGVVLANFFAYESSFTGGVRIASGDVDGDGRPDLITGAGIGGGPRVRVFNGKTLGVGNTVIADFFAFESSQRDGVNIGIGDYDGDNKADIGLGAGPGGGPRIMVLSGKDVVAGLGASTPLVNFFAFDSNQRNGVRVGIKNLDGDNTGDIVAAPGTGGQARVRTFSGGKISGTGSPLQIEDFFLFDDVSSRLGAWVG